MAKMIQIRNVPDNIHRTLKVRAAQAGMSLSDYLLMEVKQVASRPSLDELFERLRERRPVTGGDPPADVIRRHRAAP